MAYNKKNMYIDLQDASYAPTAAAPSNAGKNNGGTSNSTNAVKPVKGAYMTNTMAMPTYTSPTAGKQYSYNTAAPTWQWDDSVRPGDWQWNEEKPTYTNQYQDQINSMVNDILNREKFSYDYNTDPLYQMYAEAYTRNGQQAMKDTYAQQAARTGGLGSSYAGTAAQTQYNQYMNALNDKVPELYKLAYSMYQDEGNTMRNNLGMIQGLENTDYGRYMDALGQWNTDRNFSYGQYNDEWDRYYNDRDFSYGQYSDDWDRWNTNRNWDYNLWADNLDRQEAAAKAAYNSRVNAYNQNQAKVDAYNRGVDEKYAKDMEAYNKNTGASNVNSTTVTTNKNGYQWNGKTYSTLAALQQAIDSADISDKQWAAIKKSMLQNHVLTDEEYSNLFG